MACGGGASPDDARTERDAYLDAVRLTATDPAQAAERCRQAGELTGECLAAIVEDAPDGENQCAGIEDPMWRDECWFMVAEHALHEGDLEAGYQRCQRAGSFQEQCLSHCWYQQAERVQAAEEGEAALHAYLRTWEDHHPGVDAGAKHLFWEKYFEVALNGTSTAPLDIAWCEVIDLETAVCEQAMRSSLERALRRVRRRHEELDVSQACREDLPLSQRARLAYGLSYASSPVLDRPIRRHLGRLCSRMQQPHE